MENVVSMEEVRSKKLVRKEAGQASGGHDQLIEEGEKLSIVIHERVRSTPSSSMEQKYKSLEEAADEKAYQSPSSKPRIQRVPFMLRDHKNFEKYYEPRAVSIGPLHHGNSKLKLAEKLKLKLAGLFIKEYGLLKEVLYERLKNDLKNLKECYDEEEIKKYDDEDLAWMFLVDGCAVLYYIDCAAHNHGKKLKELKIKNDQIAFAQQDLFLMENQLPYKVLELLISSNVHGEKLRTSIKKFIDMIIKDIRGFKPPATTTAPSKKAEQLRHEPTHLLELLWERLVGNNNGDKSTKEEETATAASKPTAPAVPKANAKATATTAPKETSPAAANPTAPGTAKATAPGTEAQQEMDNDLPSFRNVHELKAAGIQLKSRKTNLLTDISFSPKFFIATLELSPLVVDDSTAPKFLNMIAYEMCPDFANDFEVTSYISFLDSLIDRPEDVKELRDEGILHNFLGSDEEVAKLFNEIGTDLVPNPEKYSDIKERIQKHYNQKWKTWIAEGVHDHFSSPWTFLAFAAAIIALVLSFVQTWYTIYPV